MAGPICMKFSGKVWSDHGTTWFNFGSIQVDGSAGRRSSCLLSPAIAIWFDCGLLAVLCCHLATENVMKLLFLAFGYVAARGGVCCAAHHSLYNLSHAKKMLVDGFCWISFYICTTNMYSLMSFYSLVPKWPACKWLRPNVLLWTLSMSSDFSSMPVQLWAGAVLSNHYALTLCVRISQSC